MCFEQWWPKDASLGNVALIPHRSRIPSKAVARLPLSFPPQRRSSRLSPMKYSGVRKRKSLSCSPGPMSPSSLLSGSGFPVSMLMKIALKYWFPSRTVSRLNNSDERVRFYSLYRLGACDDYPRPPPLRASAATPVSAPRKCETAHPSNHSRRPILVGNGPPSKAANSRRV